MTSLPAKRYGFSASLLCGTALVLAAPCHAQPAPNAQPAGGRVTAGTATITQAPAATTINQASSRAVVDWRSFDVGSNQSVTFQQPSNTAVTLNRVDSANPSQIAGRIDANGQVVLVNQSGVVFNKGAQVNAQSLVVSAAGISNENFMAGRMVFDQAPNPNAQIRNDGDITVRQAGLAALVAPSVVNNGVIRAKLGHVILAGANTHTLDLYGDGMLSLDVTSQVRQAPVGANGKSVSALVTNNGLVQANGGTVLLTASAADGVVQNLVTANGRAYADTIGQRTGTVLVSGTGGSVQVLGQIRAAGRAAGTVGGQVEVNATGAVTLGNAARVSVSGTAGGGAVAIGTTLARAAGAPTVVPKLTAASVTVAPGATISADATVRGNGGRVVLLSAGQTVHAGSVTAKGGPQGGNGGAAEVSGETVVLTGAVDVSAPLGATGSILLDPLDLTITSTPTGDFPITQPSASAPNVAANAQPDGATSSYITPATIQGLVGTITLQATRDLFVNNAVTLTGVNQGLSLEAGRNLIVSAALSAPGYIYLKANSSQTGSAVLSINAPVTAGGTVYLSGSNVVAGGYGNGIVIGTGGLVSSTAGANSLISIACDCAVVSNATVGLSAAGGTVERGPLTAGISFALGTLSTAIQANTYVFGEAINPQTGAVTQFQNITLDSPAAGVAVRPAVLDIEAAGAITQLPGAFFASVGTLTAHGTAISITGANNAIGTLGPLSASTGGIALDNSGTLTVSGAVSAATAVSLLTTGGLSVNAPLSAGSGGRISLQAATFAFSGTGSLSAPSGTVELAPAATGVAMAVGGVTLAALPAINAQTVRLGGITDPASGQVTAVAGSLSLGGTAPINLDGKALDLQASGSIGQAATAPLLNVATLSAAAPSVSLTAPGNAVATLGAAGVSGGSFSLADAQALTVAGPLLASSLVLTAPQVAFTGLDASGSSVTLDLGNGTAAGRVNVGALTLNAQGGSSNFTNSAVGGVTGGPAAAQASISPVANAAYTLNGCPIGVPNCGVAMGSGSGSGTSGGGSGTSTMGGGSTLSAASLAAAVRIADSVSIGIANVVASETNTVRFGIVDPAAELRTALPLVVPLLDLVRGPLRDRQADPDLLLPNVSEKDY